jgi:hypothetical protein
MKMDETPHDERCYADLEKIAEKHGDATIFENEEFKFDALLKMSYWFQVYSNRELGDYLDRIK